MSQHDMIIDNAGGGTVRADINDALQALGSTSKGGSAPGTPYAGQLWLDDDTPSATVWTLNQYDGTDWIKVAEIDTTNNRWNVVTCQSADVASASTLNLDTAYGVVTDVTGTTTITAITLAQGRIKIVRFTGALTLTHGSSLVLPGAANITTAAGDYAIFSGYAASVVRCVSYVPTGRVIAFGGQISFPATQNASSDANTLDDYEEGTWTPAITFATPGNLSVAYSVQVGDYTKVGRDVRVTATLVTSSFTHTTASGNLNVTGFPFTSATLSNQAHYGATSWQGITKASYTNIVATLGQANTTATLQASGSGQGVANIATGDVPTGGSVRIGCTMNYPAS